MVSPLVRFPDKTVLLAPQYFGSTAYYGAMVAFPRAVVDTSLRYDKRFKSIHRCTIADVRGPLTLTVPVGRPLPDGPRLWSRVLVSDHGQWWSDHRISLESAYGRTPFFEFYEDRLLTILSNRSIPVTQLCTEADAIVRAILGLDTEILPPESIADLDPAEVVDLRFGADHSGFLPKPYYQVRADRLGFIPALSILDLISNLGPESPLAFLPKD